MSAETTIKPEATPAPAKQEPAKPVNPAAVKKAISLGKEMSKQTAVTKADVARKMFELISGEPREVIVDAFVEGASLTPKGAQTYYYNCKRKTTRAS
jgi:predicted DNA-binding protein (UPF0251 family)